MELAVAILVVVAAVAAVGSIARLRGGRAKRAEWLEQWALEFAVVAQKDRDPRALKKLEEELATGGIADDDVAQFLERPLEDRLGDARATLALVSDLGQARIRDAASGLRELPPRVREALVAETSDLEELPTELPAKPDAVEVEVAVRYLELIQDAAVRANNTAGRLFVLRIVVTLILLAIAAGVAKTGKTVDLLGFGLELDPWTVLVAGSVVASVMQFFDVPYYERGHQLGLRAVLLYEELGYRTARKEWTTRENPLRLQYAAAVTNDPLLVKLMSYDAASLGGQVVGWLFLIITQIVVFDELRDQGHDGVWVYVFLLLPLATAVVGAVRYRLIVRAHQDDARRLAQHSTRRPV